jgi:Flp pilus assembly protein TadB
VEDIIASIVVLVVFAFVGFILALVAAHVRAQIRHRTEVQKELIAKFSSSQELADFLNSEAGKLLLRGAKDDMPRQWPPPRPVEEQIGIAIGWGVLVLCVGAAVLFVRGVTLSGAVITALGIGLLFNALLRLAFHKKRSA